MKEAVLVLSGFLMGWAAEGMWPWLARSVRRLRRPPQWFRRSAGPRAGSPAARLPQPGPRPVVGQRPSEGTHRARQSTARFAGRSYRSRRD